MSERPMKVIELAVALLLEKRVQPYDLPNDFMVDSLNKAIMDVGLSTHGLKTSNPVGVLTGQLRKKPEWFDIQHGGQDSPWFVFNEAEAKRDPDAIAALKLFRILVVDESSSQRIERLEQELDEANRQRDAAIKQRDDAKRAWDEAIEQVRTLSACLARIHELSSTKVPLQTTMGFSTSPEGHCPQSP